MCGRKQDHRRTRKLQRQASRPEGVGDARHHLLVGVKHGHDRRAWIGGADAAGGHPFVDRPCALLLPPHPAVSSRKTVPADGVEPFLALGAQIIGRQAGKRRQGLLDRVAHLLDGTLRIAMRPAHRLGHDGVDDAEFL